MLIFEYQCQSCFSVFESVNMAAAMKCVECGSTDVERTDGMVFAPNRNFCPKEPEMAKRDIRAGFLDLLGESERKCYYKCD